MKKLFDLFKTYYIKYKEIINYLISGVLATIISFGSFALLDLWLGDKLYIVSNTISIVLSVLFQYFSNKFFVFEHKKQTLKQNLLEFGKFISCRVVTAFIDNGIMFVGISLLKINKYITKLLDQVIIIILNYIFSKLFVFTKKKENKEPAN